jgi:hypothetical protein
MIMLRHAFPNVPICNCYEKVRWAGTWKLYIDCKIYIQEAFMLHCEAKLLFVKTVVIT